MSEQSSKSFLNILTRSGLIEADRLKQLLADFQKNAQDGDDKKLGKFIAHLIESGLITEWHLEKIKAGKYRGFFLGKYKLLRLLGTGGMSSVYLAEHSMMNKRRALKVLPRKRVHDKSYLERFYREGRAAALLNHKNIVRVYDIDSDGKTHYLVMEYVEGIDLYEMVKASGPLSIERSIDYLIEATHGLNHAHESGLVHRDIKPANVLVGIDNVVKLLDMGLALFREEEESLTVTHNEKVIGTADYLAPEQAINSHEVDHRADIYGLGCTLYFLLTGHPPFPKGTLAQRIAMHQSMEPNAIERDDCPVALHQVLNAMMQKNPQQRYQNCGQVLEDLTSVKNGKPISNFARQATVSVLPGARKLKPNALQVDSDSSGKPAAEKQQKKPPISNARKQAATDITSIGESTPEKPKVLAGELSGIPVASKSKFRRKPSNNTANIILSIFIIGMLIVLLAVFAVVIWFNQ